MSANENNGLGQSGIDPSFSARNPQGGLGNGLDGRDDPNRGPLDRAANALDGRDDPNRGPLDRADNALDGRDDPNRGPLDRAANAMGMGASASMGAGTAMGATAAATSGDVAANPAMTGGARSMASAVFDSQEEAQRAVADLRAAGVRDSDLSLIAQHRGRTTTTAGDGEVTDEHHRSLIRGILGGGALGAGLGVAALAIPGVGPLAAAGAIAASVVPEAMAIGAAAGAIAGTLNETLTKHGVSEEDATYYGDRIKSGGTFVSVDTSASGIGAEQAREILYRHGGHSASRARSA
jgi:hypothetical protein